jgi:tetratricopeptide (TPR) repeat protein
MKKRLLPLLLLLFSFLIWSCSPNSPKEIESISQRDSIFTTPLGVSYVIPEPSEKALTQYQEAKTASEANPEDKEALIWYGRRTAYLGQYQEAIAIYSKGLEKFPDEARLFRHRGHRYISLREYGKAIADLEQAAQLISGTPDEVEPDGMPNAQNIPVSTLQGNIWYHLGLAYYLDHQYEKAYTAYLRCRETGDLYDNIVSSTHWLYMIQQRLGNPAEADSLLAPISQDSTIIENQSYADLCHLYKGGIPVDSLITESAGSPANDAVRYGVANWYLYHGDSVLAKEMMIELVKEKAFSSFGYLAAESDLIRYFGKK